jgi:hypothetical protein
MKPEQIYHELKELAEKFEITVSEQNFRKSGIKTKSGFCIVGAHKRFIIDKHLRIYKKIDALGEYLSKLPHEDIYIVPAVREVLSKYEKDR